MSEPSTSSIFSQILGGAKDLAKTYVEYKASEGPKQKLAPDPEFATAGTGANPAPMAVTGMPFDPKWVFVGVVALVVILGGVAYVAKK